MTSSVTVVSLSPAQVTIQQRPTQGFNISVAKQGPPGPPGDMPSIVAGMNLSGHRVIAVNGSGVGIYADHSNGSALSVQGVSTDAALLGTSVQLFVRGKIQWPAGGLTPDMALYLGNTGAVTQVPPTTGWLRHIGMALSSDLIMLDIWPAFWLGE